MSKRMALKDFETHVGTDFVVIAEAEEEASIELIEAKGLAEAEGGEAFSLLFRGPAELEKEQMIHGLRHEALGELEIFLVPMQPDGEHSFFEAVFA